MKCKPEFQQKARNAHSHKNINNEERKGKKKNNKVWR